MGSILIISCSSSMLMMEFMDVLLRPDGTGCGVGVNWKLVWNRLIWSLTTNDGFLLSVPGPGPGDTEIACVLGTNIGNPGDGRIAMGTLGYPW